MAVQLFGNVNGRNYNPPMLDLLNDVNKQTKQLENISKNEVGNNSKPIEVNISQEGLRALHGSKLKGSMDLEEITAEIKFVAEHQPIESFTNRFARIMPDEYIQIKNSGTAIAEEKGELLLNKFKNICDEIVSGYANGNRIRYREDETSENGYVKISKEEELAILLEEFSAFVENRFGKQHQEDAVRIAEQTNDIQNIRQKLGIGTNQFYEPLQIPAGFTEKLLADARQYIGL